MEFLDSVPNGIVKFDREGIIVWSNKSMNKLLSPDKGSIEGLDFLSLAATHRSKQFMDSFWNELKTETKWEGTFFNFKDDRGTPLSVYLTVSPVSSDNGISEYVAIATVIPDSKPKISELHEILHDRETLIKEIHHRVKNNLAVISGLLTLQKYNYDDERLFALITDSEMRIKSMALIHEKLYKSTTLSSIDFSTYMTDLVDTIAQTFAKRTYLSITVNCEPIQLSMEQAVPSALIVNEIISNSVKYAFPENMKGNIHTEIVEQDNKVQVMVEDDGVGLPDDFEERRKSSLGYTIIDTLIQQLEADLSIESKHGTRLYFVFEKV